MISSDAPGVLPPRAVPSPSLTGIRLVWLHLVSRRVPTAAALLAGLGVLLWTALHWHWSVAGGPAARGLLPLAIETGAAALIAVTTYSSFGEQERTTGRWLPWLRLCGALLVTATAVSALAAGAAGGLLPGGILVMLRNLAGMTGIGFLASDIVGGALGWIGPMAYWLVTESALAAAWTTPWVWPARPPQDLGGALCAAAAFVAGTAAISLRGSRDRAST